MRKQILYILAILVLLLAACSAEKGTEEESKNPNELPAQSEKQPDEENNGQIEDEAVEEEAAEAGEEKEALYEMDANWGFQPIDDANPKAVLLTIDDAPDKRALDMAKTLKELNAPAIFFVNGHFLNTEEQKEALKEIHEMGFAIGNHTKTHEDLQQISEDEQKAEILSVSDTVEELTGERPKFFRAPFGQNTDYSKGIVAEDGMLLMNWSFGYDWEKQYMNADALADIMVNTELMRDGANLLMHDRDWTADALKEIVEGLRAKGYDFIDPQTIKGIE